jgi:hypothetical protein
MRPRGDLEERVERAQAHVQTALDLWRAAKPGDCDECCLSLEAALGEIKNVRQDVEQGGAFPVAPLKKRMKRLTADVNRLTRLVDAATAFCRGMALTIGRDSGDARPGTGGVA